MRLPGFLLAFLFFTLASCSRKNNNKGTRHVVDPLAQQYADSAMELQQSGHDSVTLRKVIDLYRKAVAIDSNFFTAYMNILQDEAELGDYPEAVKAGKHILALRPEFPDMYGTVGTLYFRMGDTVNASRYYNKSLSVYDSILDTLNKTRPDYKSMEINRATVLVMLGRNDEGNAILKKLYDAETDDRYKSMIGMFLNKSRKEILDTIDRSK